MIPSTIYEFIKKEETNFEKDEIQVADNWYWNFRNHVQLIFHLKNGVFFTGANDYLRAFKNIFEPILNLSYWTEDLEVKDVLFYIEETGGKVLSFLLKKYHDEVYTREHNLDTLFDEITESDLDYGGVIVQKGAETPEVLQLNSIAFGDQTDILGGPIGFKFYFSPSKLRAMSKLGWGDTKNGATITLDELCILATGEKDPAGTLTTKTNKVPGKTVEVYIVRGNMPESFMKEDGDPENYIDQVQVVAYYTDKKNNKTGVTLYRKEDDGESIKFFTSKKVHGRALGRGVGETLIHPQIWTNFLTIHKTSMLEAGSKVPLYTDDPNYTQKNKIQDMDSLEITTIEDNKRIYQVPTVAPANIQLYEKSINEWYMHAQISGSANDPLMGVESPSGTTFRGQERTIAQGRGIHDRRRGQRAKFIEEIYRDWIIPDMVDEITEDTKFLATLSTEELRWVADQLATCATNDRIKEMVLSGKLVTKADQDGFMKIFKDEFYKKGNRHLVEILKGDFDGIEVKMGINIAGKQKNIAQLSDKILSIFQFIFANPQGFQQAMQIPALSKSFEDILEFGGLSIGDFSSLLQSPEAPAQVGVGVNATTQIPPSSAKVPQLNTNITGA